VFRAIPSCRAIAAFDRPSEWCSRRISAQSSMLITPQAVDGVLNFRPSITAQSSADADTASPTEPPPGNCLRHADRRSRIIKNNTSTHLPPEPTLRLPRQTRTAHRKHLESDRCCDHHRTYAALKCLYLVTRSLDPTGKGQARWTMRWKPVLNAFANTFSDGWPSSQKY
jgi:hypothetical protein